jgi:hypothetical protein
VAQLVENMMDLEWLADQCRLAALEGRDVELELPVDWARPSGVPFPARRPSPKDADADGFALWAWKPHALLMFVHDTVKETRNEPTQ